MINGENVLLVAGFILHNNLYNNVVFVFSSLEVCFFSYNLYTADNNVSYSVGTKGVKEV